MVTHRMLLCGAVDEVPRVLEVLDGFGLDDTADVDYQALTWLMGGSWLVEGEVPIYRISIMLNQVQPDGSTTPILPAAVPVYRIQRYAVRDLNLVLGNRYNFCVRVCYTSQRFAAVCCRLRARSCLKSTHCLHWPRPFGEWVSNIGYHTPARCCSLIVGQKC